MAKFIYLYRGPATPMTEIDPVQLEAWGAWMGKVGPAMVDGGSPFGARVAVSDDGSTGETSDLSGYTILEADDLAAAQAFTDGHPFLADGAGKFAIDIFELLPM